MSRGEEAVARLFITIAISAFAVALSALANKRSKPTSRHRSKPSTINDQQSSHHD